MRDQGPLSAIPYPIRLLVGYMAHSKTTRTLYAQGTGRYTKEELVSLRQEAWTSVDELVADASSKGGKGPKWVLGGENPTEADACLHGFVASSLTSLANPEVKALIQGLPNLVAYASKIHNTYFPDYQKWT